MIRILRVVINPLLFGLISIKKFFSLKTLHYFPTFRRLILEFVDSQGEVMRVIIKEIARIVQRIEGDYDSLSEFLPLREVYKRFVNQPVQKHLFQRSVQERINAAK